MKCINKNRKVNDEEEMVTWYIYMCTPRKGIHPSYYSNVQLVKKMSDSSWMHHFVARCT